MTRKLVTVLVLSVLWTNQARADLVPAIDYTGSGTFASTPGTYGYSFTVLNNPLIVDALAVSLPFGPAGPNTVRIWQDGTTTTLASATIPSTAPVSSTTHPYQYQTITPVTLLANTTYDIALDSVANQTYAIQVTGVSNNLDITFGQARSAATPNPGQFPTTDALGFGPYFGPSFEASPVPEPTSFALVGMGVGAVVLACRHWKKNQHATKAA